MLCVDVFRVSLAFNYHTVIHLALSLFRMGFYRFKIYPLPINNLTDISHYLKLYFFVITQLNNQNDDSNLNVLKIKYTIH